jgi:hypothetical protein
MNPIFTSSSPASLLWMKMRSSEMCNGVVVHRIQLASITIFADVERLMRLEG